jgi:hypothetical protein
LLVESQLAPTIALERYAAADDTDSVTSQTVALMCRYINEAADTDPAIQRAAQWAANHYAQGSSDPKMLAWAAFWFVKHNVKFVVDESPLFRLGEVGQQDLLISPSVLIRMQHPQEDCDGFTMLLCAILRALGVPYAIVTVAVDGQDPQRWSHVFGMALTPSPLPLDASHGSGPGWMVPAARTFRWQCWSCDGQPVNIPRPRSHGLHGWEPSTYGLGVFGLGQGCVQTGVDDDGDPIYDCSSEPTPVDASQLPLSTTPILSPTLSSAPAAPASSSSFNWASLVTGLSTSAASAIKSIETTNLATAGAAQIGNLVASAVPIVLVVVIGSVLISALGNKK